MKIILIFLVVIIALFDLSLLFDCIDMQTNYVNQDIIVKIHDKDLQSF